MAMTQGSGAVEMHMVGLEWWYFLSEDNPPTRA